MDQQLPEALSFGLSHARQLLSGRIALVMTGAGISTDSGIPDYRGAGRVQRHPLTFDEFNTSATHRARYWARSFVGWTHVAQAEPNPGHIAIAEAEAAGKVGALITQNVDGLHQRAGSKNVLELHGRLDRVLCSGCGDILARSELDARIQALNPELVRENLVSFSPDGDADVEVPATFRVPECGICGAHYKPDVVFFGEQVPRDRVQRAEEQVSQAEALIVAGSSLTVNSGLRLVKLAKAREIPILLVNLGQTKADKLADIRLNASTSVILPELFA